MVRCCCSGVRLVPFASCQQPSITSWSCAISFSSGDCCPWTTTANADNATAMTTTQRRYLFMAGLCLSGPTTSRLGAHSKVVLFHRGTQLRVKSIRTRRSGLITASEVDLFRCHRLFGFGNGLVFGPGNSLGRTWGRDRTCLRL